MSVDPTRWLEIRDTLVDVLQSPDAERDELLAVRCAGRPTLKAELESLLASADAAGGYFEDLAERVGMADRGTGGPASSRGGARVRSQLQSTLARLPSEPEEAQATSAGGERVGL